MKIVSVVNLVNNLMVNNGIYKNNSKNFYKVDGDLSISKMIFLNKENFQEKASAHLITSGPWGRVHFWNVFHTQTVQAQFSVVSMTRINKSHTILAL